MKIQSKLARRSLSLATGALFAAGTLMLTTQVSLAATQQLGGKVNIQPRDINTQFTQWMDFGDVKVGPDGGTLSLSNDTSISFNATGDVVHTAGGSEGSLAIQGESNYTVTVTVDSSFTLSAQNVTGAADLSVDVVPQGSVMTLLAANGEWNYFQIGGVLTIPGNQPADAYQGMYNATVNYQ